MPSSPETWYDAWYFRHCCGRPYERSPEWLEFFGRIADRIVADIGPRTVMDVGCAMGFLVEALRDRGVEAFGIDTRTTPFNTSVRTSGPTSGRPRSSSRCLAATI